MKQYFKIVKYLLVVLAASFVRGETIPSKSQLVKPEQVQTNQVEVIPISLGLSVQDLGMTNKYSASPSSDIAFPLWDLRAAKVMTDGFQRNTSGLSLEATILVANCYLAQSQWENAKTTFVGIDQRTPNNPHVLFRLAQLELLQTNNYVSARSYLERIPDDKQTVSSQWLLLIALTGVGDYHACELVISNLLSRATPEQLVECAFPILWYCNATDNMENGCLMLGKLVQKLSEFDDNYNCRLENIFQSGAFLQAFVKFDPDNLKKINSVLFNSVVSNPVSFQYEFSP